ncbi:MAG TPA: O-antigen polymerase [Terriglobales bacterium]|nr:O-antigen polymerase [Terriglobales bacterium]
MTPVSVAEIVRAVRLGDLALVVMTAAWILAVRPRPSGVGRAPAPPGQPLDSGIARTIAWCVIPVGFLALAYWARLPGVSLNEPSADWDTSSWALQLEMWSGMGLIALIYCDGFKPLLTVAAAAYLAIMAYQGFDRFRVLIPLLLLAQIYVDRRKRRWPNLGMVILLVSAGLLFFPMKDIGRALQQGEPISDIWQSAKEGINSALHGDNPDELILDQFASTLTLADRHGKLFLGETYAKGLAVFVPRLVWPSKPSLAEDQHAISTIDRPMAENGMVATLLGECYLNFGYVGIIAIPFLSAYLSGRWYSYAYQHSYSTVARFTYLIFACNLIQIFRDGLSFLPVFAVINMLPLATIAAMHWLFPIRDGLSSVPILRTPGVRTRTEEGQPVG